jgi:hypothetical protein
MADRLIGKLYKDTVEVVFTPGNHRYSVIDNGAKTYPLSVTAVTGLIDKSAPLMIWAVNLAIDFMLDYIKHETEPTMETVLKYIVSVQKELTTENLLELEASKDKKAAAEFALKTLYKELKCIPSERTFTKTELENVLEQARKQHTIRKLEAATIGGIVHDLIENYVNAKINNIDFSLNEEFDERVVNGFQAFIDWEKAHNVKFLHAEKLIYSKQYGYVGMCDCIAIIDKKLFILDWKTGKGVYNEMLFQVSAYGKAHEEESGEKVEGLAIIHLHKDTGDFSIREISLEEYKECADSFVHCLAVKKHLKVMEARDKERFQEFQTNLSNFEF